MRKDKDRVMLSIGIVPCCMVGVSLMQCNFGKTKVASSDLYQKLQI